MKKILIIFIVLISFTSFSQEGFKSIVARTGISISGDLTNEIAIEWHKENYKNISIFFSSYTFRNIDPPVASSDEALSFNENQNWNVGFYYDPNLMASRNNFLNLKLGASLGTNSDNFLLGVNVGFEYNIAVSRRMQISFYQKNNAMFFSSKNFRHSILIGLKYKL